MILVTGATGKVGSQVVEQLVEQGQPVRALVRDPQKAAAVLPDLVELSRGDLTDVETIREALDGARAMFLLAPPDKRIVQLEQNAIAAAKDAGVRHLVKLSAILADSTSRSVIEQVHGQSEQNVRASGIPFTFLQPNFFMQNLLGLAGMVKAGTIYQPAGDQRASHVDIVDIAAVAAKVLTSPAEHAGKTYVLTGPQALSFDDIANILASVTGKAVRYQNVPRDAAKESMKQSGMSEWQAEAISQLMDDYRDGRMAIVSEDVPKLLDRPARSVEQFVRENAGVFMA